MVYRAQPRYFVRFAAIAAVPVVLVSACSSPSSNGSDSGEAIGGKNLTKVSVSVQKASLNTASFAVAQSLDLFAKHNLDVKATTFPSGQDPTGAEQLLKGSADIAISSNQEFASADSQAVAGGGAAPIAIVANALPCATDLVLAKDINFTGPSSLNGLKIGVSSVTSAHIPLADAYLNEKYGTNPSTIAWKLIVVPADSMPAALASGQIDGFLHSEPTASIAIQKSGAHIAWQCAGSGTEVARAPTLGIAVARSWAKTHSTAVQEFVAALQDATAAMQASTDSNILSIYSKWTGADTALINMGTSRISPGLVSPDTYKSAWSILIQPLIAQGKLNKSLTATDLFDFSQSYPDQKIVVSN